MAVPKRKTPRAKTRQRRASNWTPQYLPNLRCNKVASHRLR